MPLEIKELHIKATIADPSERASNQQSESGDQGGFNEDALLRKCVEEVFRLIKEQQER